MTVAIKQDPASLLFIVLAVSGLVSIATFGGLLVIPVLIAFSLLFGGLTLSERFHVSDEETDIDLSESAAIRNGGYVASAILIFTIANIFVPQIQFTQQTVLNVNTFLGTTSVNIGASGGSLLNFASLSSDTQGKVVSAFLFSAFLIPVSEEQFFRGFFGNWFLSKTENEVGIAMVANGILFAGFHVAVYGLNPNLLVIIGVSGAVFTYIDWATGTITTSMLGHVSNNALAFLTGGNIIVQLFPQVGNLVPHLVLPAMLAGMVILRRKRLRW